MDTSKHCKPRPPWRGRATLSLGGIALATALAAGCGSVGTGSGSGSGTTASPSSPAGGSPSIPCAQITSLRTALTSLTKTKVDPAHAAAIVSDLVTIRTQLQSLSSQAGPQFSGQARQLNAELAALERAARQLLTHPTPANVSSLTATVNHLKATAGPLIAAMQSACPTPGSS